MAVSPAQIVAVPLIEPPGCGYTCSDIVSDVAGLPVTPERLDVMMQYIYGLPVGRVVVVYEALVAGTSVPFTYH